MRRISETAMNGAIGGFWRFVGVVTPRAQRARLVAAAQDGGGEPDVLALRVRLHPLQRRALVLR